MKNYNRLKFGFTQRNEEYRAAPVAQRLAPPSVQGVILETQDRVPHQASCMEPAPPSASLSLSHE